MIDNTKLIIWILIYIITLHLYRHNKIRFSNKNILSIFSYNTIFYYLTILIIILNSLIYYFHKLPYKNYIILVAILGIFYINIVYTNPIINDDSYNPPPDYIIHNTKLSYILILLLLIYNLKYRILETYIPIIINIFLFSMFYHLHINFNPCSYDLPPSWS